MKFEMTIKEMRKTVVTTSDDIGSLLMSMGLEIDKARIRPMAMGEHQLTNARGEIEVGVINGPQFKIRVID